MLGPIESTIDRPPSHIDEEKSYRIKPMVQDCKHAHIHAADTEKMVN